MRKIGIFGGTFNPVHTAHIGVALAAKKQLELDFVIMLTSGNPPHKRDMAVLDSSIRHIMLKKAICGIEGLVASDYEVKRKEYSYTVHTLQFFKRLYPNDKLYFIMGGDSLDYFDEWYKPECIAELAALAVYGRGREHRFDEIKRLYNAELVRIDGEFLNISSREMRADRQLLKKYTPPEVYKFITSFRLYEANDEAVVLKELLSEKRLKHSQGVAKLAKCLAEHYKINAEEAYRAGLLHDIAKEIPYDEALRMCDELGAQIDNIERTIPLLVHPKLGAELVKCYFGIEEGEITSAIRWHTVGKTDMSMLDKIIFVADACEETRNYDGVEKIREAAFTDIDKAVLMCIEGTISVTKKRGGFLHPVAYRIRDRILTKI